MVERPIDEPHHEPVLVERVVEFLTTDVNGAYLDLTAGGGGHLKALASGLSGKARLYGTDKDPVAVARVNERLAGVGQFKKVIQTAFGDISDAVERLEDKEFDGILLDLGISSYQLDDPARGISFSQDGPLDMRFDTASGSTAADLISSLEESKLKGIIRDFGEEKQATRIAREIVRERQDKVIETTAQLRDIVLRVVRPPHQNKSLARVFQAFRIAVNQELEQLRQVLPAAISLLRSGGRLAVIAYHSLEDRQVKRFFQGLAKGICTCPPGLPECLCGAKPTLRIITGKPAVPSADEIAANPRSRSARLRVAEKI